MTLANWATLKADPAFVDKVEAATYKAMLAVANEEASITPADPIKDVKRKQLSVSFNESPASYVELFLNYVCTNGALTTSSTDNDIEFTVNSSIDAIAGYNVNNSNVN